MSRLLAIHFAFLLFFIGGDMKGADIDTKCWQCICKVSTYCNTNSGCIKPFLGAYSCGPLSISWLYWVDAGGPRLEGDKGLPSEIAFENCVKDIYCAVKTVDMYVHKFKDMDCDGDNSFTCEDVIRIHIMGGYACNDTNANTDERYEIYINCMEDQN